MRAVDRMEMVQFQIWFVCYAIWIFCTLDLENERKIGIKYDAIVQMSLYQSSCVKGIGSCVQGWVLGRQWKF